VNYARYREDKARDVCIKRATVLGDHLVATLHGANGCLNHGAAGIAEAFPGFHNGLFADDAVTLNFFDLVVCVDNNPVTGLKLCGHRAAIDQGDGVGEYVALVSRFRLFRQVGGFNRDLDVIRAFHHGNTKVDDYEQAHETNAMLSVLVSKRTAVNAPPHAQPVSNAINPGRDSNPRLDQ